MKTKLKIMLVSALSLVTVATMAIVGSAEPAATAPQQLSGMVTSEIFMGILNQVLALVPILLPAVIGFLAFRKGWQFLKSQIKGA